MSAQADKLWPAAPLAIIQKEYKCIRHLITISSSPVTYWADGRIRETDGVNIFEPRRFVVQGLTWGALDQAGSKIVVDNRDSAVSNLVYSQNLTSLTMTIGILVKQEWTDDWEAVYEPISTEIADVSGTAHSATIMLSGLNGIQRRSGLKQGDRQCRHVYKGLRCQYAGPELTCDRSRATCVARGNAVHFGGFAWALQPGEVFQIRPASSQETPGSNGSYEYTPPSPNQEEEHAEWPGSADIEGPDQVTDIPVTTHGMFTGRH